MSQQATVSEFERVTPKFEFRAIPSGHAPYNGATKDMTLSVSPIRRTGIFKLAVSKPRKKPEAKAPAERIIHHQNIINILLICLCEKEANQTSHSTCSIAPLLLTSYLQPPNVSS
jgi:hypothetical protein